jgi:hypothetical protein
MTESDAETWFYISLVLTLIFVGLGDDDVAYKCMKRKPIGNEVAARLRFVAAKMAASGWGGALMVRFGGLYILERFPSQFLRENILVFWIPCFVVVYSLVGALQNIVRFFQGRKPLPLFEKELAKYNLEQWSKWFKGS